MLHALNLSGQDSIESYIREYPNQEQVRMMTAWLDDHRPGRSASPDSWAPMTQR